MKQKIKNSISAQEVFDMQVGTEIWLDPILLQQARSRVAEVAKAVKLTNMSMRYSVSSVTKNLGYIKIIRTQ